MVFGLFRKTKRLPPLPPLGDAPNFEPFDLPNLKPLPAPLILAPQARQPQPMRAPQPIMPAPIEQTPSIDQPEPLLQPSAQEDTASSMEIEPPQPPPSPASEHMMLDLSYVKVEDFREMLGGIQVIKSNLKECDEIYERLNQIKNDEDKEFEKLRSQLEDLQRKLVYVDKVLFEEKGEA